MTKENKQYLLIGIFVLLGISLTISIFLWFSSNGRLKFNTYVAVFNEAVDGLSDNSAVKYNGVEIGHIEKLELNTKNLKQVFVYLSIDQQVPINVSTYATIKAQGVTGLSYIDLRLPADATSNVNLVPHNSKPYPQIATHPSFLSNFSEHAQTTAENIEKITMQLKVILSQKNIEHIDKVVDNLDKVSQNIASVTNTIEKHKQDLGETMVNINKLSKSLTQTMDNINSVVYSVKNNTLQNINTVLLPNLSNVLLNLNQSSYQLQELLMLINQNPAVLIRGKSTTKPGPGEQS